MLSVFVKQQKINNIFNSFNAFEDKYQYLLSFSKLLIKIPEFQKNKINLIKECQSNVWLYSIYHKNLLFFYGISNSIFINSFLYITFYLYSKSTPKNIIINPLHYLDSINLILSYSRQNGVKSILDYIYFVAKKYK